MDLGPGKSPLVRDISGMRQLWGSCRARGRAAPSRGCPGGEKVPVAATTPAVPQTPRDPRKAWLGLDPLPDNPGAAQSTGKSLLAHLLFLECCEARNPIALKGKKGSGKCLEPCCHPAVLQDTARGSQSWGREQLELFRAALEPSICPDQQTGAFPAGAWEFS